MSINFEDVQHHIVGEDIAMKIGRGMLKRTLVCRITIPAYSGRGLELLP